jgi:hypothetical protein
MKELKSKEAHAVWLPRKEKHYRETFFLPFDFGIERSRKGVAVAVNFKAEMKTLGYGQKIVPHFSLSCFFFFFFTGLLFSLIFR